MRKYFGTDGVRGRVGQVPIMPDFELKVGYCGGAVMIGKDTRISGYMLESALESAFSAAGVNTLLTGPMPAPAWCSSRARCDFPPA